MKKEIECAYFECTECENCCLMSIYIFGRPRYSPRKPKGCPIGLNSTAKWRGGKKHPLNESNWENKYHCDACQYLCLCSPAETFKSTPESCPMYYKFYENRIYKYTNRINRGKKIFDDNPAMREEHINFWKKAIREEKQNRKKIPHPNWMLKESK